jgi:SAM-dependent methyltransferase
VGHDVSPDRAVQSGPVDANAAERARWNNDTWTKAWRKREVLTDSVTPLLLEALQLRSGERVLDVGCGGGQATIAASRLVQPGGSALGADISEPLLALARERAAGEEGVTFDSADLQTDQVGAGGFDAVMSQFGVMFFDEPVVAFTNIARHLRPGGRLGFACWQTLDRNPWFVGPVVAPFVAAPPPTAPGKSPTGPFVLGEPDRVRQILRDSGFGQVQIAPHSHQVEIPESAVTDDAQLAFMGVSPDAMDEARQAVALQMQRFATEGEMRRFSLAFQIVIGRV